MTGYTASLDFAAEFDVPRRCPDCGAEGLASTPAGEHTVFRCRACRSCWNVAFGRITPANPFSCAECAQVSALAAGPRSCSPG